MGIHRTGCTSFWRSMGSSCQIGETSSSWVLNDPSVTFEQTTMLLRQVQACLNSLPLYAFSDNPEDLSHHLRVHVSRDDAATTLSVAIRSTEIASLLEAIETGIPKSTANVTKVHSSVTALRRRSLFNYHRDGIIVQMVSGPHHRASPWCRQIGTHSNRNNLR